MTNAEWSAQYRRLSARADRVRAMRHARMDRACREAGIGQFHGCVLHNALIAADQGRPWRGVDTAKLRLAHRIERSLFDAHRIVSRWARRTQP